MNAQQYKCGRCEKKRNPQRFSSTTIRKYEESLRRSRKSGNPSDIKLPVCQNCNGQPLHELECAKCGIVKSLDLFSKQQRKNPDNAECIDCVQERQDREACHRIETEEQEIIENYRNGITPTMLASSRSVIASQSLPSHAFSNSRGLSTFSEADEDGWIQPPVEVPEDPRERSSNSSDLTNSMGQLSVRSALSPNDRGSVVSGQTTGTAWDQFRGVNAAYREQTGNGSHAGSVVSRTPNPGFAKQGAVKQDMATKAHVQFEREQKRKQEQAEQDAIKGSDSDDDDEDDDDDDEEPF